MAKTKKKPTSKKAAAKSKAKAPTPNAIFAPLDDRVVVRAAAAAERTQSGIIIPGNAAERPNQGEVLATGPGHRTKKGKLRPLDVQVGDQVLFAEYMGMKVQFGGEELLIIREQDLLAIVT